MGQLCVTNSKCEGIIIRNKRSLVRELTLNWKLKNSSQEKKSKLSFSEYGGSDGTILDGTLYSRNLQDQIAEELNAIKLIPEICREC